MHHVHIVVILTLYSKKNVYALKFENIWENKEELKRFESSHEKMIQRYEGFTGLEVYHMAKDGKNSLLQSNEFWDTYEEQLQNCRETWIGNEEQLNSCIQQVHVDLDIEN